MNKAGLVRDLKKLDALIARRAWPDVLQACQQGLRRHGRQHGLMRRLAMAQEATHGVAAALPFWIEAAAASPGEGAIENELAARLDHVGRPGEACFARFRAWRAGGADGASLLALGQFLVATSQTLSADDVVYDGFFFLRESLSRVTQPSIPATVAVNAYLAERREDLAAGILLEAIVLDPGDPNNWRTAGAVAFLRGRIGEAGAALSRAIAISEDSRCKVMHALLLEPVPISKEAIARTRGRIDQAVDRLLADPMLSIDFVEHSENMLINLFSFAYHGENDRPLLEKIGALFRRIVPGLVWSAPHVDHAAAGNGPIRIAFVGSLHIHAINLMINAIIAGLDRNRFSPTCFSLHVGGSIADGRIGDVDVVRLPNNLGRARQVIADYAVDIVFYTDLFLDNFFYFLAFSRLGRVQCLWPGHPSTSGLPSIDYIISSVPCEPPNAQDAYTEKLLLNEELNLAYPSILADREPVERTAFGLSDDAHLYVCAQTLYKLHPDFDPLIDEILARDPKGVAIFFENSHVERAAAIAPRFDALRERYGDDRVRLLPRLPFGRFLGFIEQVDVLLDTPHFCGGNTTLQALQLGVPVVTRPSDYLRGRSSLGFYSVMGFTDLVAQTDERYVELAVRLANDAAFRARCRDEILARQGRLFGRTDVIEGFARIFEALAGPDVDQVN